MTDQRRSVCRHSNLQNRDYIRICAPCEISDGCAVITAEFPIRPDPATRMLRILRPALVRLGLTGSAGLWLWSHVAKRAKKKTTARKQASTKTAARKRRVSEKVRDAAETPRRSLLRRLWRWLWLGGLGFGLLMVLVVLLYRVFNPPTTPYMFAEGRRLGHIDQQWVPIDEISPVMLRSVVAAEDANFCNHWGFDMRAIRTALAEGSRRGASTITQQVVKNTYLWQGRSWPRKALEALMTPIVEMFWSKRRILEVYLNIIEFDEGVFGVAAAAQDIFHVDPDKLTPAQAARLAAVLPNPKVRSADHPTAALRKRAARIMDGAATIRADGRAVCFED